LILYFINAKFNKKFVKRIFFKIFVALAIFILIFPGFPVLAIGITNPLNYTTLEDLVFMVATAVVPLMIVIAGFYFVTSSGNPRQIDTAKKIILYTLIGYAIIFISRGLISVIKNILSGG